MLLQGGKILFISQYGGIIGGLEVYMRAVSNLLRENGCKTAVIYLETAKNSEMFFEAFDEKYHISQIENLSAKDFDMCTLHKISDPTALKVLVEKFSPIAFVHDHDYFCPKGYKYYPYKRMNCTRAYNRLFCGVCASIVPPRHYVGGVKKMLAQNFCRISALNAEIKKCPRFVVLSHFMKRELVENSIPEEKINVIHSFLPSSDAFAHETLKNGDAAHIVFAGQQVMSKGTPLFLEAMSKVSAKVVAHILGTGARIEEFSQMSHAMGLDGKVVFEGFVKDPCDFFERADFAVFPSLWQEPFGLSGIEAMNCALPVVAFDVGGVREWLKNNVNGILVSERNTSEMANAIDALASNGELRARMGNAAKECIEQNYSISNFLKYFEKLI